MPQQEVFHTPVLVNEVLTLLRDRQHVLDGTHGGGGHAAALLSAGVRVTAVDRDPRALAEARRQLGAEIEKGRLTLYEANYADLADHADLRDSVFDGILLDLGVSSHQLDEDIRGFTFRRGAPLDMRMGADASSTAAEWLGQTSEGEMRRVFKEYGDEPRAGRLAGEIVRRRARQPLVTSDDLVGAIRAALGASTGPSDFARLFQAVRIAVNDELRGLERALPELRERLTPGGVLAVITYHSGEDRLVKDAFRQWSASCVCPPRHPVCTCRGRKLGTLMTRKPIVASDDEIARNPRARSAHLRAWQRAA